MVTGNDKGSKKTKNRGQNSNVHRGQRKAKTIKIESYSNKSIEGKVEGLLPSSSRETTPQTDATPVAQQHLQVDDKSFFAGSPFVEVTKGIIHMYKNKYDLFRLEKFVQRIFNVSLCNYCQRAQRNQRRPLDHHMFAICTGNTELSRPSKLRCPMSSNAAAHSHHLRRYAKPIHGTSGISFGRNGTGILQNLQRSTVQFF